MFNQLECDDGYCVYRITQDTVLAFLPASVNPEEIPAQGLCTISQSQGDPCEYPGSSKEGCPIGKGDDFCQRPWAKKMPGPIQSLISPAGRI